LNSCFSKINYIFRGQHGFRAGSKVVNWFKNFLSDRQQKVKVEDNFSAEIGVTSGVPQGSVLGPLAYTIHGNCLQNGLLSTVRMFADDCALSFRINSVFDCLSLQNDLKLLSKWCMENGMVLNISKCQIMSFSSKKEKIVFDYMIDGSTLQRTESATYLGVIFNDSLSFANHIEKIIKKANSALYFLKRVFSKSSTEVKEKVYFALVRSKLEYASTTWDPFKQCEIDKIEMVQRHAARFVYIMLHEPR